MFRIVVQESRLTPTSGKVVAQLGSYDPHNKVAIVKKDKASFYLTNGAQPSNRAALLFQKEGIELPKWVKLTDKKQRGVKNPAKLRRNQPKTEAVAEEVPVVAETAEVEAATTES